MNTRSDIDPELLELVGRADPMRDPRVRANAGLDTESALRRVTRELDRPPQPQVAWWRRRTAVRIMGLAVIIAAAVFVVANVASTGNGSGVPRAQARTILLHVRQALVWPPHAIYEEESIGTGTARNGASATGEDHEWLSTSPPYNMRLIRIWGGKEQWEQAFVNHRLDIYDPRTNTIYLAPPVAQGSTSRWCQGTVVAHGCQQVPDEPQWNSALSEVQSLLEQPRGVTINPNVLLDGKPAIELTFAHGRFSYWISADTYQPLQVEDRGDALPNGQPAVGIGTYPIVRVLTGAAAAPSLLSLQAQHPDATVDHSPTDYAAALWRMHHVAASMKESITPPPARPQSTPTTTPVGTPTNTTTPATTTATSTSPSKTAP